MKLKLRLVKQVSFFVLLAINFSLMPNISFAVTTPSLPAKSACVTTETMKMHDGYVKQMEKDIAPYAQNDLLQEAITSYKRGLDFAWEAMEDPYCGFGSYGSASAKKSYKKTIVRTRDNFLASVKGKKIAPVIVEPIVESNTKIVKNEVKETAQKEVEKKIVAEKIPKNLKRGMRNSHVSVLQKKLCQYYGLPVDANNVTGYFGPKTEKLVIKFQFEKKIISSARDSWAGLVGPLTTAAVNEL